MTRLYPWDMDPQSTIYRSQGGSLSLPGFDTVRRGIRAGIGAEKLAPDIRLPSPQR